MDVTLLAPTAVLALDWQYAVENLGDNWRCTPLTAADAAYSLLEGADVLLLLPCGESDALLALLQARPPLSPPFVLGGPDGPLPPAEELPALLSAWRAEGRLPALHARHLPVAEEMAAALLRRLGIPRRLRAWAFLPQMLALTAVHPPLLRDLQHGLYPLAARRCGMTAAGVERSLRLCVESTWMHGSLPELERFFGASVDPEKGKPTNREFLRRMQQLLTQGMKRLL